MQTNKPVGSGWFALTLGSVCICVAIWVAHEKDSLISVLKPNYVLAGWMIFSGLILALWGFLRIRSTSATRDFRIGQDTINLCVAIMAVTFTLLAIVLQPPTH